MPKTKDGGFYAVHKGHTPGVYTSWPDCEAQVKGFRGAMYKKFATSRDAESFVESGQALPDTASTTSGKSSATRNAPVRHHPYETGQHHASRAPREAEPSSSTSSGIRGHGQRPRMEPDPQIASLFVQPTPVGARPVQEVASAKGPRSFHSLSTNDKVKGGAQSDADIVYTDGACRGNGKAGAVAGIGTYGFFLPIHNLLGSSVPHSWRPWSCCKADQLSVEKRQLLFAVRTLFPSYTVFGGAQMTHGIYQNVVQVPRRTIEQS
ncbi:RNA-DNA hybrid ribonuclease [Serendipita sp. 397]|nr:RNA-DNA hybrid ribonuclease [Serendipita sp. 397]